jgi:hypothetical protein
LRRFRYVPALSWVILPATMQIFRTVPGLLALCALMGLMGSGRLAAQTIDAGVTAPGVASFRVGGVFTAYDARFGHPFGAGPRGRQPLTDEAFFGRVDDGAFAPFATLRTGLNAFFDLFPDAPLEVGAGEIALATSQLRARADHRVVPFEVDVGVLPRVSVGVRVPLVQHWLEVTGFQIAEGNVGWNPNPTQNRALLATVDTALAALGASPFLPTQNSELGAALLERVRAATDGQELQLPTGVPDHVWIGGITGIEARLTGRHEPGRPAWALGDSEVRLSARLLGEDARAIPAGGTPLTVRAAVDVGVRLPTGTAPDADYLVFPKPEQGIFGYSAGLRSELSTPRVGAGMNLRVQRLNPITLQQRLWPGEGMDPEFEGLPAVPPSLLDVRWEPGTRLAFDIMPFARIVDEIRIAAAYGFHRRSGESFTFSAVEGGATESVRGDAATAQRWGVGLQYSTLDAYREGRANVPFDASIFVRNSFTGGGGAPAGRTVEMQGRLFIRLW